MHACVSCTFPQTISFANNTHTLHIRTVSWFSSWGVSVYAGTLPIMLYAGTLPIMYAGSPPGAPHGCLLFLFKSMVCTTQRRLLWCPLPTIWLAAMFTPIYLCVWSLLHSRSCYELSLWWISSQRVTWLVWCNDIRLDVVAEKIEPTEGFLQLTSRFSKSYVKTPLAQCHWTGQARSYELKSTGSLAQLLLTSCILNIWSRGNSCV